MLISPSSRLTVGGSNHTGNEGCGGSLLHMGCGGSPWPQIQSHEPKLVSEVLLREKGLSRAGLKARRSKCQSLESYDKNVCGSGVRRKGPRGSSAHHSFQGARPWGSL